MNLIKQIICTFIVCYTCLDLGIMYSWPSSTIQQFSSSNTTLSRPLSDTEQALFGSLFSVTALISNPLSGFSLDLIGRKKSCILSMLTQVVAWAIISVCKQVEVVFAAVCISGLGAGLLTIVPLYISEICHETVRGTLTAGSNVFFGTGIVFSYILGGYLNYDNMNYASLSISIVGVIMLGYMKESPIFLMNKNLEQEAAESIAFYRSLKSESKEVLEEISMIRRAQNPHPTDVSPEEEALKEHGIKKKLSLWQFLKKSKSTQRGLVFSLLLVTFTVLQGLAAVQVYAEPLFNEAMPTVSGNTTSVLFGLVCTAVSFVGAFCLDLFGRRALTIYPSIGTGVCCLALGSQIQLHWGPSWLTGVFLYCYGITYILGAGTVPYVYIAEIFLPEISSFMIMLILQWGWVCTFITLFAINPLVDLLGLGPLFYIFAAACFMMAMFAALYLPETKALTVEAIQSLLVSGKRYYEIK